MNINTCQLSSLLVLTKLRPIYATGGKCLSTESNTKPSAKALCY